MFELSILCEAAPFEGRMNEDAGYCASDGRTALAVAVDGASQRLDLPILKQLVVAAGLPDETTPAAYVARHTRDFIKDHPHLSPWEMIAQANRAWRSRLETIIHLLTAEHIAELTPHHAAILADDPRLLRLLLPACVVTMAKVDHQTNTLSYAHAGDTALFAFYKDGSARRVTRDQMAQHDGQAISIARQIWADTGAAHLSGVIGHPEVTERNLNNGLYHNYVDEQGQSDPMVGVGVIDGLLELESYIEVGELSLESLEGVLLCSDGIPLPIPADDTPDQAHQRLTTLRNIVMDEGLHSYLRYLRQIEANDPHLDKYPRFKVHDDITAVLMRFP